MQLQPQSWLFNPCDRIRLGYSCEGFSLGYSWGPGSTDSRHRRLLWVLVGLVLPKLQTSLHVNYPCQIYWWMILLFIGSKDIEFLFPTGAGWSGIQDVHVLLLIHICKYRTWAKTWAKIAGSNNISIQQAHQPTLCGSNRKQKAPSHSLCLTMRAA